MRTLTDNNSPKKPTNLSVNRELLNEAKALNINLSATLEQALMEKVRQAKQKQWLEDNQEAINACNELVEKNGLFSDKHRIF